jgi:hypothetical protein
MWKGGTRGLRVGSADLGISRSQRGPDSIGFRPGDCQVGLKVAMGVFALFLSFYLVVVGLWIRELAPDWSRVCFFGPVRSHGHVGACVTVCRHMAWCGSHRVHMMSRAHLSFGLRCMQMICPFRSSRRAPRNGADQFGI